MIKLPLIKLDFIKTITDDTGIFQHTKFGTPNRHEGYTTDDNARALIAVTKHCQIKGNSQSQKLIDTYLSFLFHMQKADGKMHNFMGYDRSFLDYEGSEDCTGRTLWACGIVANSNLPEEKKLLAKEIFDKAFPWTSYFKSPRAHAFTILGLAQYNRAYSVDSKLEKMQEFSTRLIKYFETTRSTNWPWFETYLTYENGRLPQALFETYRETKETKPLRVAEESLRFLFEAQILDDIFVPIGNKGWCLKGKPWSVYDQQSVEAASMTEAALTAHKETGDYYYEKMSRTIFNWFLGKNTKDVAVYNSKTGACYDGITEGGLNLNQGAEANVCYLSARMDFEIAKLAEYNTRKVVAHQ